MKKYTFADVTNGICAIKNDGTVEQLREALKICFPNYNRYVLGTSKYYEKCSDGWVGRDATELPSQSVADFFKEEEVWTPQRGDMVLVRFDESDKWEERIYLTTIKGLPKPIMCVKFEFEEKFKNGQEFNAMGWKQMKQTPKKVNITMQEIADKFGCTIEQLNIVK